MRFTRIDRTVALGIALLSSQWSYSQALSDQGLGHASELSNRQQEYELLASQMRPWEEQNRLLRKAVRLVSPTVVHIEATKEEPVQEVSLDSRLEKSKVRTKRVEEAGAGVVIEVQGRHYVLTNRHVIQSAQIPDIRVETYDGVPLQIVKITEDPSTDLAVIDVGRSDLAACRLGDSRTLEVGEHVFAVGSPFGLNHSVSLGIVSAKGRRNLELGNKSIVYQDFIQTDAAINPGNSGGPLMNLRGEVVGINTAIASNSGVNEGIGFAIPIQLAMAVATQLIEKGELQRSYLGVSVERAFHVDPQTGLQNSGLQSNRLQSYRAQGALVKVVKPNSPAESAGLRYGDIILEFDGVAVENDEHLVQMVGLTASGKSVELEVLRERMRVRLKVWLTPIAASRN
ncbi:MAG: trypsin-like peptidase domain-containing protein [Pirellula sp.]|jgi:serine protease Do|nr:trypsin-like peptidase domain-containing protein [Pirellula sp.]